MPITFVPSRAEILICDFDMANVPPEMRKQRRVVVVSPRSYNRRHGIDRPGRCVVVPISASTPLSPSPAYVIFPAGAYRSFTRTSWAVCDTVTSVSHDRLTRVQSKGEPLAEIMTETDMIRIEAGLRHALGFVARR